jgi:transcriptional regulator with XRE-family HTH domain
MELIMNFTSLIENVKELSRRRGISATRALIESGAGKDFIVNLRKGQKPSVEKVRMIAVYFGVSVDYLLGLGRTSNHGVNGDESENDSEKKIVDILRQVSPEAAQNILGYATAFLAQEQAAKERNQ